MKWISLYAKSKEYICFMFKLMEKLKWMIF
jgi:hypothetical protein